MRLGEIDFSKKVVQPKLYLCKPNKEIISRLNESYDINYSQKLGALDEISFKIPIYIDNKHMLVRNPNYDSIKGRYLVRLILGGLEEYFVINQIDKVGSDDEYMEVKALNLGYELNDKIIRDYEVESSNATSLMKEILKDTIWNVGYIDSEFDLKYRALDISSNTVLEVVFEIAKTFNALTVWDSLNRTVGLYKPDSVGLDKGFKIKYGKYLESLNQEDKSEEIITRLKLYGSEDISIREINPTGSPYIEDFSYFIHPYEEERYYEHKVYTPLEVEDTWISNQPTNWSAIDKLYHNPSDSNISIVVDNSKTNNKNYKLSGEFKATNNVLGMFGYVVRYKDNNNYYIIQWEHGSPNVNLDNLENLLVQKREERESISENISISKNELFVSNAKEKALNDEVSVLNSRIGSHEALIISETARGRSVNHLVIELAEMQARLQEVLGVLIPQTINIISEKENLITNLETAYDNINVEISNLDADIVIEESSPKNNKLKLLKMKDGVAQTIAESNIIRGWDMDVHYKMDVETHNNDIMVWVDNVLVLTASDYEFETGSYGIIGQSQMFEVSEISVDIKEYDVVAHSEYMSDDLAHYLLEYDRLLQSLKGEFENIIAVKGTYDEIYFTKKEELNNLNTQLKILLDERDIINTRIAKSEDAVGIGNNNEDLPYSSLAVYNGNLETLKNQLEVKLIEITAKENEVRLKENEIVVVEVDISSQFQKIKELNIMLSVDNNFSKKLLDERNQYIIEKEWSDNNIETPEDLLKEGIEVFNDLKQQKITLKVELVNFLSMITEQRNWDKLNLGDTFLIEHEKLRLEYEAKITEIDYNFEEATIDITITNVKDVGSNSSKFVDMLYSAYSTSTTVDLDSWKWDLALGNNGSINDIINGVWDANRQKVLGAKDQVVELSDRGLIIRDPNDPNNYLVGLNSMIAITNDKGKTWKHAITSEGIVGERIFGKVIMGVNLAIEDADGIVKWRGSKGEIFDRTGRLVMKMGLISNPEESVQDCFGLVAFNDITRVKISDCVGFSIEQWNEDDWRKVLWANTDGTLYAYGLVVKNIKIVNNVDELMMDAENSYFNIGLFQDIVADGKLTTLEKLQVITELYKIHSDYKLLLEQAGEYIRVHRDDVVDVNGAFNALTQSLPTTASTEDRYSTNPLSNAYSNLIEYIGQYIKIINKGLGASPLEIDVEDPLTESTSEIDSRANFILMFKSYYDEAEKLRQAIQDTLYYAGINMGEYYNNLVMGEFGLIVLRSDGKYRAFLNATNGLALQKWENNRWTNKLYASIGSDEQEDGTLIAEDLVAKRLTIRTTNNDILLDADALNFNFTVLDSIIYDDIIMSPEKSTLLTQFASITEQKNKLKEQISRYANTIYNDRENSYLGLDEAKSRLIQSEQSLDLAYANLKQKLDIVFADMNAKTVISTDLGMSATAFRELYKVFHGAYETARSRLEDFLEKSSLQLGRDYNKTVIDAENGITVTRENMKTRTRLNATQGISIARNDGSYGSPSWTDVFYVNTEGNLYAVDITTHGLHIVDGDLGDKIVFDHEDGITIYGNNGEVIRLNANVGIAIEVNNEPRLWIHNDGTLRAKKLIIHPEMEEDLIFDEETDAYISDLMVNSLKSLNKNSMQDYVYIKDNFIKLVTGNATANDVVKWQLELYNEDEALGYGGYPKMTFGAGMIDNPNLDKGYIIKTQDKFSISYTDGDGYKKDIELIEGSDGGITLNTNGSGNIILKVNDNNYISISASGVKIVGTRIDLN